MDNGWAWDLPVPASGERMLLLALIECGADQEMVRLKQDQLNAMTLMSRTRIRSASDWLVHAGLLEIEPSKGGRATGFRVHQRTAAELPRPNARRPPVPVEDYGELQLAISPNALPPDVAKKEAIDLTKRWWASQNPRPINRGGFPAAMKIAERAILAGWQPHQVEQAMALVPTLTASALEFQLRRQPRTQVPGSTRSKPEGPKECWNCRGTARYKSDTGDRCASCEELWEPEY
jgi:hypothetical protein